MIAAVCNGKCGVLGVGMGVRHGDSGKNGFAREIEGFRDAVGLRLNSHEDSITLLSFIAVHHQVCIWNTRSLARELVGVGLFEAVDSTAVYGSFESHNKFQRGPLIHDGFS